MAAPDYMTQPKYLMDRNADYSAYDVRDKFEVDGELEDFACCDVADNIHFDPNTKCAYICRKADFNAITLGRAVSSALLMYRLGCLFKGGMTTWGASGYKVIWTRTLRHRESGVFVTFGDYKGGSTFWTTYGSVDGLPTEFKNDLLALLTILVSDTCPHPYDGVVAGSVA